jgi:hypothetical protein
LARSRRPPPAPQRGTSVLDLKAEIDLLAARVQLTIKVVGSLLAGIFTWVQLKDFPFIPLLESAPPDRLLRFIAAIYYFSWVFGSSFDVRLQQAVYVSDPSKGRLTWKAIVAVLVLLVAGTLLLWASNSPKRFVVMLNMLVMADLVTWQFLFIARTAPIIRASKELYTKQNEFVDLERLNIVENYMMGKWHWYRFAVLGAILLVVDLISLIDPIRVLVSNLVESAAPALKQGLAASLLPVLAIMLFVIVGEGWKWILRLKIRTALDVISALKVKYKLTELRQKPTGE